MNWIKSEKESMKLSSKYSIQITNDLEEEEYSYIRKKKRVKQKSKRPKVRKMRE